MEVWKIAFLGKVNNIIDLHVTKVIEDGEYKKHETFSSPGGSFDAPVYQIAKYNDDRDFYKTLGKLYKNSFDKVILSRDAKTNVYPYFNKGKKLYPEFFIWKD